MSKMSKKSETSKKSDSKKYIEKSKMSTNEKELMLWCDNLDTNWDDHYEGPELRDIFYHIRMCRSAMIGLHTLFEFEDNNADWDEVKELITRAPKLNSKTLLTDLRTVSICQRRMVNCIDREMTRQWSKENKEKDAKRGNMKHALRMYNIHAMYHLLYLAFMPDKYVNQVSSVIESYIKNGIPNEGYVPLCCSWENIDRLFHKILSKLNIGDVNHRYYLDLVREISDEILNIE